MNCIIDEFVEGLAQRSHSATVTNPYLLPGRSDNLRWYLHSLLDQPGRRILVVGEALGYRGGLYTGIPLSSARLVAESPHPFWRRLRPQLTIGDGFSEATASIVWDYLQNRRRAPLFWNAFPFHPHLPGQAHSNRAPVAAELDEGLKYLRAIVQLYQPQLLAGLGLKGSAAARRALPDQDVLQIRHPSYGGKVDFVRGMDRLLR